MASHPHLRVSLPASTGEGARTWLRERLTSAALVPLGLWFAAALLLGPAGASYQATRAWLAEPVRAAALLLLLVALAEHARLGLRVIVEDYVHAEPAKLAALALIDLGALALGLLGAVAVLVAAAAGPPPAAGG